MYAEVNKTNNLWLFNFQGCLAEAERKNEQMMEFNVQLENEKSDLMHTVHELRGKVSQLMEMFCDIDMTCGTIKQVREKIFALSSSFRNNVRTYGICGELLAVYCYFYYYLCLFVMKRLGKTENYAVCIMCIVIPLHSICFIYIFNVN